MPESKLIQCASDVQCRLQQEIEQCVKNTAHMQMVVRQYLLATMQVAGYTWCRLQQYVWPNVTCVSSLISLPTCRR